MLIAPHTMIFCLFFGILFTSFRVFFDQRRTVFLNSWKELSSENIVRLQLSFWCCSTHSTRLLLCSVVSIGVPLGKVLLYPVRWSWRCTVHRDTLRFRFWRNFSTISSVVISLFRRIHGRLQQCSPGWFCVVDRYRPDVQQNLLLGSWQRCIG